MKRVAETSEPPVVVPLVVVHVDVYVALVVVPLVERGEIVQDTAIATTLRKSPGCIGSRIGMR
jgi:hypothetical protein